MDLRQLRYFSAVVTLGSFSRAAEDLHVAQSAISRQIQSLEEEVGIDLLRRKPKLQATEAGLLLLERATGIIREFRSLRDDIRQYAELPKGLLRVGMVPFSGQPFMPRAIASFMRDHPQVRVQVQTAMSGLLTDWLRDDVIDVAAMHGPWVGIEFACEPLVYSKMVVVLPPKSCTDSVLVSRKTYSLEEVAAMPLIMATRGNAQRILLEGAVLSRGLTINVIMEADNLGTILSLVQEGVGCTVVAYGAVHALAEAGAVRVATLAELIRTDVSLVTNAQRPGTAALRQFSNAVRAAVAAVAARKDLPPDLFQLATPS